MIVKGLELSRFFTYADCRIVLPPGLTVLTGDNGAGKSSVYEAAIWALTGQTVRGSKVRTGQVKLQFEHGPEAYTVSRNRTDRGQTLGFWCGPEGGLVDLTCQTATDTQARLQQEVGSFDRLVSSSVFARDFMAKFGSATDKERKTLLEEMLGLQQFDRALKLARDRARQGELLAARADQDLQQAGRQLQSWREEQAGLRAWAGPPTEQLAQEAAQLADLYNQTKALLQPQQERIRLMTERADEASGAWRVAHENVRRLEQQVKRQAEQATKVEQACRQCGRPFDQQALERSCEQARQAELELQRELQATNEELTRRYLQHELVKEELAEEREAQQADQQAQQARKDRHAGLKLQLEEARRYQQEVDRLAARVRAAEQDQQDASLRAQQVGQQVAVDQHVVACFGLKGARATLLGRVLSGIEREANLVLGRLSPTIRVKLDMTESDQVQVQVRGAGDGDYRGCSGGERVRIDIALMLGLASRQGSGWLVFDEVFDALDQQGVERVAGYLTELARTRQVLVISHLDNLVQLFPHAHHLRARMGDFSELGPA